MSLQNYKQFCVSCHGLKAMCRDRPRAPCCNTGSTGAVLLLWAGGVSGGGREHRDELQPPWESLNQAHSLDASPSLLKALLHGPYDTL